MGMECLTMVCTAPSESLSLIQCDAYKKYVLISLIRKQHLVSLPRYTPRILTRYFPKFCGEYLELNTAFDSNANSDVIGKDKLKKIIEKSAEIYLKDNNYGLVKKVMISCAKNAVKKLTSVDTKLSIKIQNGIEKTLNLWNGLDNQQLKIKQSKAFVEKSLNLPVNVDQDMQQQLL